MSCDRSVRSARRWRFQYWRHATATSASRWTSLGAAGMAKSMPSLPGPARGLSRSGNRRASMPAPRILRPMQRGLREERWAAWLCARAFCLMIAHRNQPSSAGSRLVSGLRSCLCRRSRHLPRICPVASVEIETPPPLQEQRRHQTGFPIIPSTEKMGTSSSMI